MAPPAAPPADRPTTTARGAAAEAQAAAFLARQGLRLVESNFRVKGGEIDLICKDGRQVVFVEVRARARSDFGGAAASITPRKQQRLILAARHWLQRHGEASCRFDAVLIEGAQGERLTWLRDVISAD